MKIRTLAACSTLLLALTAALSAQAAPQKTKVAVMPLESRDGVNPTLAEVLTELLAAELTDRPNLSVITPKDIEAALGFEKQKAKLNATVAEKTGGDVCTDNSCLQEIGGALGVDLMVSGTVSRLGSSWIVTVQSFNPRKAEVVKRHYARVSSDQEDALLEEMPKVAAELFPTGAAPRNVSVRQPPPAAQPAFSPVVAAPQVPVASNNGLLRVSVTCGEATKVVSKSDLIVERMVDDIAKRLSPKNSVEAQYTEYEVPAGVHQIRVSTLKCTPQEQTVTIDQTSPSELNARLALHTALVKFKPSTAGMPGRFILRDSSRKELCVLPCEHTLSAGTNYAVWYENDGNESQAGVPSLSLLSGAPAGVATVNAVHERSMLGPGLMLGSLLYMGIGAGYYLLFSNIAPSSSEGDLFITIFAGGYFGFGAVIAITGAIFFFSGAFDEDRVEIKMTKDTNIVADTKPAALQWAVGPTGFVLRF